MRSAPDVTSVWCGPVGSLTPAYARRPDEVHYAASTMKVAVLAAVYRAAESGRLDLDAPVPVANDFAAAVGSSRYAVGSSRYAVGSSRYAVGSSRYALRPDPTDDVYALLGASATPRWLAGRMITRSSNLATNLVLAHVGLPAVGDVLRVVGADRSRIERGIEDTAARAAGLDNVVTARDLAALMSAIAGASARLARAETCAAMLDVLLAQERRDDLAAGLPSGTRVAHKNGWVHGVRHAVGVIFPDDAAPYVIAVCTTWPPDRPAGDARARRLIARLAAASWADRHAMGCLS